MPLKTTRSISLRDLLSLMLRWNRRKLTRPSKLHAAEVAVNAAAEVDTNTTIATTTEEAAVDVVDVVAVDAVDSSQESAKNVTSQMKKPTPRTRSSLAEQTKKRFLSPSRRHPKSRRTSRWMRTTSLLCERVQQVLQQEMTIQVS